MDVAQSSLVECSTVVMAAVYSVPYFEYDGVSNSTC